jgi:hypothetical protein
LHGRLPAFSGAVDAFERARKCFLEWRYFFSIILSEFLKNRVALQPRSAEIGKRKGNRSAFSWDVPPESSGASVYETENPAEMFQIFALFENFLYFRSPLKNSDSTIWQSSARMPPTSWGWWGKLSMNRFSTPPQAPMARSRAP